ncbi:lipopolysaccharide-induced tumor necrosis factor-alpha factor homolog [Hyposmocoma kahamanoa]|uniref:lipopolysaccharide-induced tumor necrosis factor-alpha factor homolog n=1 Tax=Hyposmocoma kahamanoa TaxID=1477025 RepID=UPI000E6D6CD8|nr:lipopolysaccharide-induced tumor necrosis factor-alpha factor homolog [Hyposmocoma kahamanoa]
MEEKSVDPPPYSATPKLNHQHPPAPVATVSGEAIVQTPIQTNAVASAMVNPPVGPNPCHMTCRSCGAKIVTRMEFNPTTKTHLMALFLCCFGLWCCVCLPYCMDSCQNADHYCPNCNAFIGVYSS